MSALLFWIGVCLFLFNISDWNIWFIIGFFLMFFNCSEDKEKFAKDIVEKTAVVIEEVIKEVQTNTVITTVTTNTVIEPNTITNKPTISGNVEPSWQNSSEDWTK